METQQIYQEELVRIIKPLKARVFSEKYEKAEFYGEDEIKTIVLREKEEKSLYTGKSN